MPFVCGSIILPFWRSIYIAQPCLSRHFSQMILYSSFHFPAIINHSEKNNGRKRQHVDARIMRNKNKTSLHHTKKNNETEERREYKRIARRKKESESK